MQHSRGRQPLAWRLIGLGGFGLAGLLLATSAITSQGSDLRDSGFDNLRDLVTSQADHLAGLRAQVTDLNGEIDSLTASLSSNAGKKEQKKVDALKRPAGLTGLTGPGITVTLSDAPKEIRDTAGVDVSQLLVHQQDIQAVMNALWAGGAEAMSVQGQRVISTTGVKCVGNSVIVDGVPYAPPYVIKAIGDPNSLELALLTDNYLQLYRQTAAAYQLGWNVAAEPFQYVPAYSGSTELEYARVATTTK